MKLMKITIMSMMIFAVGLLTTLAVANDDFEREYRKHLRNSTRHNYHIYLHREKESEVYHRGIISGEELRQPMGQYKMKGFFGGYSIDEDGNKTQWQYDTDD